MNDASRKKELGAGMRLLLDLGPLILFFIANARFGIFTATAAFIVAVHQIRVQFCSIAVTGTIAARNGVSVIGKLLPGYADRRCRGD